MKSDKILATALKTYFTSYLTKHVRLPTWRVTQIKIIYNQTIL